MRVNNPSVAEDLVQETFLAGIKSLKNFGGRSTLKTWLTGILKFKVMDHYRKSSREKTFTQLSSFYEDEEKEHFGDNGHWLQGDFSPAEWSAEQWENIDRKEFMSQFLLCSDKLPQKIRQVYLMREVTELIARIS
jgi:RNA polymerase sigma-70 factor (ECF subfamily)